MLELIHGLIIGLFIGMPFGPIGAIYMRVTLKKGIRYGFMAGIGGTVADATLGAIVIYGVSSISHFLVREHRIIQTICGIIAIILGITMVVTHEKKKVFLIESDSKIKLLLSTFSFAVINPATVISLFIITSTFSAGYLHTKVNNALVVLGIYLGSFLWMALFVGGASALRKWLTEGKKNYLNKGIGVLLIISGVFLLINKSI